MSYVQEAYAKVEARSAGEPEFLQAVKEVFQSLEPVFEKRPDLAQARILERLAEPGRTVFALHALQGLSLAEISRHFRRSESWARVLYYRAKRRIIAAMKEDGLDGL